MHYILSRPKEEILAEVLMAQNRKPIDGDWLSTVKNDIKDFEMDLTIEEIKNMTKENLKNKVKESMKRAASEYLMKEKSSKSKMQNLNYNEIKLQNYFSTSQITTKRKIILFKARTRMLKVWYNFGQKIKCPLCKIQEDKQEHLL